MKTLPTLFAFAALLVITTAVHAQVGDGGLIKNTVINDVNVDDITNVTVFEPTAIAPTGLAFNDPIDPQFTGDLDAILAANSLTRFDVFDVLFDRTFDGQTLVSETLTDIVTSPDAVLIGDLDDDPCLITVLNGTVTVTMTTTNTTTDFFTDTLTIQLFADAAPNTVPAPAALPAGLVGLTMLAMRRRR